MFARLFLLFVIVPVIDLFLLVWISGHVGIPSTIGLVILTAAIGAWLVKLQGAEVRRKIMSQFSRQESPADLLTDGAMIFFAAGLLLTPGLLTDVFGFTLLTPFCRRFYKRVITGWFKKNFKVHVVKPDFSQGVPRDANTVDGEVVREKPVVQEPDRIEE
ncbi:FxsA family protein [Mariniblastus fucicola]|uniref:Phage T7 F exclusion suppressor FxsA n=1 Tax=Mariniblastus fucicola TaxID=980251 RepID=A0A5B9PA39_9BACT|nr:FxsA family protein [Mariniblastus fucicola]QEG21790.1 phage T7 F exclusion suppressor FxsA [Mariniblastus fucicola]